MRLIDADALYKDICDSINQMTAIGIAVDSEWMWAKLNDALDNAPTIEERKKGKWIKQAVGWKCSNCVLCTNDKGVDSFNFCPNCGADMRESNKLLNNCSRCKYGKNYLNNMWWCEKHDMMKNREGESCSDFKMDN